MRMPLLALFLFLSMLSLPCLSNPFKAALASGRIEEVEAVIAAGHDLNGSFLRPHGRYLGAMVTMLDIALRSYSEDHPFIAELRKMGALTEMEKFRRMPQEYVEQHNEEKVDSDEEEASSALSPPDSDQEEESTAVASHDSEEDSSSLVPEHPILLPILFDKGSGSR